MDCLRLNNRSIRFHCGCGRVRNRLRQVVLTLEERCIRRHALGRRVIVGSVAVIPLDISRWLFVLTRDHLILTYASSG